jgi:hypothetical protein
MLQKFKSQKTLFNPTMSPKMTLPPDGPSFHRSSAIAMMLDTSETSTAAEVTVPTAEYFSSPSNMDNIEEESETAKKAMIISTAEAMNPSRRNTMEDRHVILAPGSWGAPDPDMAFLAVCDGHGGINNGGVLSS